MTILIKKFENQSQINDFNNKEVLKVDWQTCNNCVYLHPQIIQEKRIVYELQIDTNFASATFTMPLQVRTTDGKSTLQMDALEDAFKAIAKHFLIAHVESLKFGGVLKLDIAHLFIETEQIFYQIENLGLTIDVISTNNNALYQNKTMQSESVDTLVVEESNKKMPKMNF